MKIEKTIGNIRYTLSNDDLKVGDKVFPIASGRCINNNDWILHGFDFNPVLSGFPDEPHIIKDLNYSDYKPEQIRTNHGYGPIEIYYKIIKKEKPQKNTNLPSFNNAGVYEWVEIKS